MKGGDFTFSALTPAMEKMFGNIGRAMSVLVSVLVRGYGFESGVGGSSGQTSRGTEEETGCRSNSLFR